MANRFTASGHGDLRMSNGSTDVFFDVLTLAGSGLATTAREQNLVLYFADGHRIGMGAGGFDLAELPWTASWPAQKQFFLHLIDTAAGRHGWDRLAYDPPFAAAQLAAYRDMLAAFTPAPPAAPGPPDWDQPPPAARLARCPAHDLYQGELGCRLCCP